MIAMQSFTVRLITATFLLFVGCRIACCAVVDKESHQAVEAIYAVTQIPKIDLVHLRAALRLETSAGTVVGSTFPFSIVNPKSTIPALSLPTTIALSGVNLTDGAHARIMITPGSRCLRVQEFEGGFSAYKYEPDALRSHDGGNPLSYDYHGRSNVEWDLHLSYDKAGCVKYIAMMLGH